MRRQNRNVLYYGRYYDFEQLGLLFAIGVAIGMAKKNDGAVRLSYVRIFFSYSCIITDGISTLLGMKASEINSAFEKMNNGNVFVGIVIGLMHYHHR